MLVEPSLLRIEDILMMMLLGTWAALLLGRLESSHTESFFAAAEAPKPFRKISLTRDEARV
jgi:hypothetical protein